MQRVLTNGKINIGAYQFPDKKRVALCVREGNKIVTCGYFNTPESAEFFMDKLAECVGAEKEEQDG